MLITRKYILKAADMDLAIAADGTTSFTHGDTKLNDVKHYYSRRAAQEEADKLDRSRAFACRFTPHIVYVPMGKRLDQLCISECEVKPC